MYWIYIFSKPIRDDAASATIICPNIVFLPQYFLLALQEYDEEMKELMAWMDRGQEEDESDVDPLLALANQVETQATPAAMPSQKARGFSSCLSLGPHKRHLGLRRGILLLKLQETGILGG